VAPLAPLTAVQASALVQRFGTHVAVGPVDLDVPAGARLAVLGGNGAGKTTLLRMLATVARPASGRLEVLGLDVVRQRDRLRARLGYLGHQVGLYPALTALENLEFFAALHGLGRRDAEEALARLRLAPLARTRAERLSRGQQQRLALARAILHRPEVLVLDEPDASLDAEGRALLGGLLEGRTAIVATHDTVLARELCDRAVLLRAGRVAGDPWALRVVGG
jgi:heme ABC exporter ATP-binding subunit CcmA